MLSLLKDMAHALFSDEAPSQPADEFVERRRAARLGLRGRDVPVWSAGVKARLQLKDLSCGGVSGITALPAAIGDRVGMELPLLGKVVARVCWVRSTSMGLTFETPLSLMSVAKLYAMHWDSARRFKLGADPVRGRESGIAINDDERADAECAAASEI